MTFCTRRIRLLITWSLVCLTFVAVSPRPMCQCADGGQKAYCAKVLSRAWHGDCPKVDDVPACCALCEAERTSCPQSPAEDDINSVQFTSGPCELSFTMLDCRASSSDESQQSVPAQLAAVQIPGDRELALATHVSALRLESDALLRRVPRPKSVLVI